MVYLVLASLVHLAFLASTVAAQATSTATSYPTAVLIPTLVQQSYGYDPSKAAAGIFGGLYAILTIFIFFRLFPNRTWWGLCLPIGTAFMSFGFALRIVMTVYPNSLAIYLCSTLFILLAPTAFLAFNYILYGRFVINCIERRHSVIRPGRTAWYFIISDVTTFLVQATGGSFLSSSNPNTNKMGVDVIIAGLVLQTISFGLYIFLVYYVFRSLKRDGVKPFQEPWSVIMKILFFSSALFLLRCIYRTIELGQSLGNGYISTHEAFFYVFDPLTLLVGITPYVIYWPSQYLQPSFDTPSLDEVNMSTPSEKSYDA